VSERGGREAEEEGGYRTKNKNPTRQCGEKRVQSLILSLKFFEFLEGDTIFPQDNGTLFQNVYSPFTFFLK